MQSNQNHTPTRQVLNEVSSILAEHYGIKIASLIQTARENGVSLDVLAEGYYGKPKTKKQARSQVESLRSFLKNYGDQI